MLSMRASIPIAVLPPPIVLLARAKEPQAVLSLAVLLARAEAPMAVFAPPPVLEKSASKPTAVFLTPLLARLWRAPSPSAVFSLGRPPSAPRAVGESAKQARVVASAVRRRTRRKGERLSELLTAELVFVICIS